MPAAPLIAKKLSAGSSPVAIGKELDRRAHAYANEVHREKSHLNEYLCGGEWVRAGDGAEPEPLDAAIERRMGELNTRRKIRSDAVRAEGFVLSSNAQLDDVTAVRFLKEGIGWMAERYGRENLLAAAIHMDEDTPHAQFWIAPVIHDDATGYDRLSAKELFTPNKVDKVAKKVIREGTLTRLQRDFWREVASRYGYDEPFTAEQRMANGRVYRSQAAYKADKAVEGAKRELEAVKRDLAVAQGDLSGVRADIAVEQERLEWVRRSREEAEGRVAELGGRIRDAQQRGGGAAGACDRALEQAGEVLRGAKDLVGECEAAVSGSFKGAGVPGCADSRARESAARAGIEGLGARIAAVRERLGDLRQRFIEAVRGFGRGWGLLSKKGEELAREDARRPVFIGGGTFSRGDGRGKPMSLDESLRKAKAEASAWNATHSRTVPKRRASIDEL